jgi:hypothetical protein
VFENVKLVAELAALAMLRKMTASVRRIIGKGEGSRIICPAATKVSDVKH